MRIEPAAAFKAVSTSDIDGEAADRGLLGEIALFWRQFVVAAFDPYRPEKHYMRGPGPACRAKQKRRDDGAAS